MFFSLENLAFRKREEITAKDNFEFEVDLPPGSDRAITLDGSDQEKLLDGADINMHTLSSVYTKDSEISRLEREKQQRIESEKTLKHLWEVSLYATTRMLFMGGAFGLLVIGNQRFTEMDYEQPDKAAEICLNVYFIL